MDKLDVEGGTYRDPHISIAAPSDRRYAHYIVDALNHSVEALDVTLNEIYAGRLVSQDRSEAAQPELVFAGK